MEETSSEIGRGKKKPEKLEAAAANVISGSEQRISFSSGVLRSLSPPSPYADHFFPSTQIPCS